MKRIGIGNRRRRLRRPASCRRRSTAGTSTSWRSRAAAMPPRRRRRTRSGIERLRQLRGAARRSDMQVVHNATPNYLHYPVNAAALAQGKHVISDKPLAMTAAEAQEAPRSGDEGGRRPCRDLQLPRQPARAAGAARDRARDIGRPHFLIGQYLQDWLLKDTDYSWRLEPDKGRRLVGARRHRLALVRPRPAHQRPAHHARARRHHHGPQEAQAAARARARHCQTGGSDDAFDLVDIAGRGSGVGAAAVRQRREGRASRSGRSVPATRTI